jgi:hypothetical protein
MYSYNLFNKQIKSTAVYFTVNTMPLSHLSSIQYVTLT